MFCVYLTIYKGNKMPMFYIGSSSLENLLDGYRGSVSSKMYKKIWKSEIKHNPQLFKTKIISYHITRESATLYENFLHKKLSVVSSPLYINLANAIPDGCFGVDNRGVMNPAYGRSRPDASKRMSENNPMFDPAVVESVTQKKRKLREDGKHKSTRNSEHTLAKLSERMRISNPSLIRCCCLICGKECSTSSLSRYHKHKDT